MKMVHCKNTPRNVKLEPGTSATAASSGNAATWIGIDLGTTNSLVGVWQAGRINILENEQGIFHECYFNVFELKIQAKISLLPLSRLCL
jgi:molecular chaperone DnaK (HSP70)